MLCGARGTRPTCGGGGGGGSSESDDDDKDNTMGPQADSGEGSMGLEADAGTFLKIAGDAGGCDAQHRTSAVRAADAQHWSGESSGASPKRRRKKNRGVGRHHRRSSGEI
jgi:hypothetical protein